MIAWFNMHHSARGCPPPVHPLFQPLQGHLEQRREAVLLITAAWPVGPCGHSSHSSEVLPLPKSQEENKDDTY